MTTMTLQPTIETLTATLASLEDQLAGASAEQAALAAARPALAYHAALRGDVDAQDELAQTDQRLTVLANTIMALELHAIPAAKTRLAEAEAALEASEREVKQAAVQAAVASSNRSFEDYRALMRQARQKLREGFGHLDTVAHIQGELGLPQVAIGRLRDRLYAETDQTLWGFGRLRDVVD